MCKSCNSNNDCITPPAIDIPPVSGVHSGCTLPKVTCEDEINLFGESTGNMVCLLESNPRNPFTCIELPAFRCEDADPPLAQNACSLSKNGKLSMSFNVRCCSNLGLLEEEGIFFRSRAQSTATQICGDGKKEGSETCDDGNTINGDGCSSMCMLENICGNKIPETGEECNDGNDNPRDGCLPDCTKGPICGDGLIEAPEECDDGNVFTGDGCTPRCEQEGGPDPTPTPEPEVPFIPPDKPTPDNPIVPLPDESTKPGKKGKPLKGKELGEAIIKNLCKEPGNNFDRGTGNVLPEAIDKAIKEISNK